jgi:EAL domain-containing protein (putative c-di-GMP-specific phosphodiesterase class I)/CheY-like chemotaxis protein
MPNFNFPATLNALIVDDDPFMGEIVAYTLREAGLVSIRQATDGKSALDSMAAQVVELLVCDLNMPGMDGIHLMRHVAALAIPPAIILLSGNDPRILDASRQYAEAKNLIVLGTLSKPLMPGALVKVLQRYRPMLENRRRVSGSVRLDEASFRHGLETGALQLAHQPKVDLGNGSLIGIESLLRWQDERLGPIPPYEVVRAAEDAKMIDVLTQSILSQAVQDRARLVGHGMDINVSINVSMHNLLNAVIVDCMSDIISATGDLPSRYTLEVTETHLVEDLALVLETLIRARLRGFLIAIDDYGTGAASMQLLMQLPSTELKIDRAFIAMGPRHDLGRSMLKSAIELGLKLGQTVTAEGIESAAEATLATELGCHQGQGYFYGYPMSLDALIAWNEHRRESPP